MTEQVRALIRQEHHVSRSRRRMPNIERAAQFAPFAALTGFADCIDDASCIKGIERELSEDEATGLDRTIMKLEELPPEKRVVELTRAVMHEKCGVRYVTERELIRSINTADRTFILKHGETVPFDDVVGIRIAAGIS